MLLAILHGGEAAAGRRDEIGSAGQGWKFESAGAVGAGGLDGAGGAGDRGANDQRVGERVAGLVFHDTANYRGMRGGRQCEQRPFRHKLSQRNDVEGGESVDRYRELEVVQHHVDHHAGDADVEPDRQRPARDLAVLVVAASPRRSVMIASTGTVAASTVWVTRMVR